MSWPLAKVSHILVFDITETSPCSISSSAHDTLQVDWHEAPCLLPFDILGRTSINSLPFLYIEDERRGRSFVSRAPRTSAGFENVYLRIIYNRNGDSH